MNEEKLIKLVRENPVLYNKKSASYRVPLERQKAWARISAKMGASADECTRMWTSLREKYLRFKKRYKFSSSSGVLPPNEAWPLFSAMRFLEPFITPRSRHPENFVTIPMDSALLPAPTPLGGPQRSTRNSFPSARSPPPLSVFSPPFPFSPSRKPLAPSPTPLSSSPVLLSPPPLSQSPSPIASPSPAPSSSSTRSSRKRQHEVESAIMEAVKLYEAEYNKRKTGENAVIYSFGDMIVNTVINFKCPKKQAIAIQRLTSLAMEIQLENIADELPQTFKSE